MQKEGAEKRVQRVLLSTVMKSTLLLTCTRISRTIIHRSPILTMKRFTKLTSASFIILNRLSTSCTNLTIENFTPCRPKGLTAIKPYYTFAVRRTGLPEVKTIFQRRHFCPCPQCTTGDYHRCLYTDFLGVSQ